MINKSSFLLKVHYFLLFGGFAAVESYGLHISVPLGASLAATAVLGVLVIAFVLLVKPALSMAVDSFPRSRRPLFVCTVALLCISAFFMIFVPAFENPPSYSTVWVAYKDVDVSAQWNGGSIAGQDEIVNLSDYESCSRLTHTKNAYSFHAPFLRWTDLQIILPYNETCQLQGGADCQFGVSSEYLQLQRTGDPAPGYSTYSVSAPAEAYVQCSNTTTHSGLHCARGEYVSDDCGGSVVYSAAFWCYAVLLLAREFTYTTAASFTDALTLDTADLERRRIGC